MAPIDRLEARLDGVGHLLADRYIVVPPYQRPYAWNDEQITELLRDFADAIRTKEAEYFLGTVVLTKNNEREHAVIDGQQRLATVSILICAIRNYFDSIGDTERRDLIHHEYLARKEMRALTQTAHLKLIAADNGFYESEILSPRHNGPSTVKKKQGSPSHIRLGDALRLCAEHVASLVKQTNAPADVLLDWIDYIRDKAKVIVVEVTDEGAAYTIFEVLNDRGLDLSVSDLLKNFVFRMAEEKVAEAQQHWTTMVGVLEASGAEEKDLRTFIRHVWASQHGLTREKELYSRIRTTITSKQRAVDFATSLSEHARVYAALDNPSDELWKPYSSTVREAVETLGLLKATQIRPLVLAVVKHFSVQELQKALPMLVCWTVRSLIVGKVGSGPLETGYSERAKEISAGSIKTATDLYKASKAFLVEDDDFEQGFRTARVSALYLARYYLRTLERVHGTEMIVNPSEQAVTLEHVMPQSRDPHWVQIAAEQHKAYLKRMGNLTLLDKDLNEGAGNLPFAEKAAVFARSAIGLTRDIAATPQWDTKAIEARQERLATVAVKAWPARP